MNQLTQRTVLPPAFVSGRAAGNATVTVNFQPVSRHGPDGEWFHHEDFADNSTGAGWLGLTNVAVINPASGPDIVTSNTATAYVPKTPQAFTHDADGNQTSDARWTNRWDAENRLIEQESLSSVPPAYRQKLLFTYDWQNRRASKVVSNWNVGAGTYQLLTSERFVYDGWRPIAVLTSTLGPLTSFTWGLDLAGQQDGQSLDDAGGIGGLLLSAPFAGRPVFCAADLQGNVTTLIDALDGNVTGRFEYAPFGETLRTTGPAAALHRLRFSTKYEDAETGLYYYGYRYYDPVIGRWPNRDPLEDLAFRRALATGKSPKVQRRLYAESLRPSYLFARNSPVSWVDAFGLQAASSCFCGPDVSQAVAGHLNDFIQQPQGNLNPIWFIGASDLTGPARDNGQAIRNAAAGIQGCGGGPCTGTFTLCDMCISGRHIDHILIMVYMATSYGVSTARSAGQYQESFWLGFENEGSSFEGMGDAVHNADLTFNELALCIAQKLKHKDANRGTVDLLTTQEICECTKALSPAQRQSIANKMGSTASGSTGYQDCKPCSKSAQKPSNLKLPPIDL